VKFTSSGGRIVAGAELAGEEIKVYVSDTGEGVYPEEKEKIFEEFYRIGDDLAGRPKGSGLGLSISKRIVGAHGGRIWVESQMGKGSTFFFTIPRGVGVKEAFDAAPRPFGGIRGRQILILEDNTAIRQLVRETLENHGYTTLGAGSAKTAFEMAKASKPDAIITGYLEGEENFEELRTLSRVSGIPIYIVFIVNDEKAGPQVAVNAYISRPLDEYQVEAAIKEVLKKDRGRILIISDRPGEARELQAFAGTKGYETSVISNVNFMDASNLRPDLIVVGILSKDEVYRAIGLLRNNQGTRNIPVVLLINTVIRDIGIIGVSPPGYGSGGIEGILDKVEKRV